MGFVAGVYQSIAVRYVQYSKSCCYFRPSFVNCCPSNLLSGSTLSGQTYKRLLQSPFTRQDIKP
jgi:hypothetical protein